MNQHVQPAPYTDQQQYAPAGQWVPAAPPRPKSSGFRIAAGIIAIVQGLFLFVPAIAIVVHAFNFVYPAAFVMAVLALAAAIGNLTAGIVLLVKHRDRHRTTPVAVLAFAALPLLLGAAGYYIGLSFALLHFFSGILSIPTLIVMGIGLAKEKRGH